MTYKWPFFLHFSHFFPNYMNVFHKTEIQMVILSCWTGLNLNWLRSYDTKRKYFHFIYFWENLIVCVFCNFCVLCLLSCFSFVSYLLNQLRFRPVQHLKTTMWSLNLSFVKDIKVVCKKKVRNETDSISLVYRAYV